MLHSKISVGDNHILHNWEVADGTELAALVLTKDDEGKIARQLDTGAYLILQDYSIPKWKELGAVVIEDSTTGSMAAGLEVGYRTIPQNSKSSNYTLTAADLGKHILHPATDTTARTFTIPANSSVAYPIGAAITFVNMSTEAVTIAIDTDTLYLAGDGTTGSRTLSQYGMATALKLSATEWLISGTGLS